MNICLLRLLLAWEALPFPLCAVTFREPLTRLDELDHIDPLLSSHDWEGDDGEDGEISPGGARSPWFLGAWSPSVSRASDQAKGSNKSYKL